GPWTETPVAPRADQVTPQSSDRTTLKWAFSKSLTTEPGSENGTLPSRVLYTTYAFPSGARAIRVVRFGKAGLPTATSVIAAPKFIESETVDRGLASPKLSHGEYSRFKQLPPAALSTSRCGWSSFRPAILTVDDATRCNRARHQFRAVAAARAHIEHLHVGMRTGEGQELDRVAPLVGLHVRFGAVGRGNDGGVIGRAILRRRCGHRQACAQ